MWRCDLRERKREREREKLKKRDMNVVHVSQKKSKTERRESLK